MPIYTYKCERCGDVRIVYFTTWEKARVNGFDCNSPICLAQANGVPAQMVRQLSAPNFHLKGPGFYSVDYPKGRKK